MVPVEHPYRGTDERRREIVDATIRVLAEHGFANTSFSRIRETAGLSSTRLISYHFADKSVLLGAVIEQVVNAAAAVMVPAMEGQPTIRGKLDAYIRTNLRFLADNPLYARAAVEVIANTPRPDNRTREDTSVMLLATMLMQGQQAGELCEFDCVVVARAVRAAIDAFASAIPESPRAVDTFIDETADLFDRATTTGGVL